MQVPAALASFVPSLDGDRNAIREMWDRCAKLPGGAFVFAKLIDRMVPYTGTIDPRVVELREGYARVQMRDHRGVRNHLRCVHAIALANLAELTGNLAVSYSMPDDARFIVAGFEIEYIKKARGTITATSTPPVPKTSDRQEYPVEVIMTDSSGEVVSKVTLRTLVGPKKKSQ